MGWLKEAIENTVDVVASVGEALVTSVIPMPDTKKVDELEEVLHD